MLEAVTPTLNEIAGFLDQGGPAIMAIAGLSVITLALILWKAWRLLSMGAWAGQRARKAVALWGQGEDAAARLAVARGGGLRARVVRAALAARSDPSLSEAHAREETVRVARIELTRARAGLRALELIATIAPLIGLMGTVLGMISAFQALQEAGARADPATLAGGIWEALLTTAAGMAVAIPASIALTWFESIADRLQGDMEDQASQIFTRRNTGAADGAGRRVMLGLDPPRPRRKPSLTPMIDVVFLLLVFFMLASRFGSDFAVPLQLAGTGATPYSGPPRIIEVLPEGQRLNGVAVDEQTLLAQLQSLTETPQDTLILRPGAETVLQRIIDTMALLEAEGFTTMVLVE